MPDFETRDGVRLHYDRQGRGPRVYACHGGPANDSRYWAEDLAPLTADFELVFWDYRGSGRSGAAPEATYRIAKLADDLDELRHELGDERIVVLAHSMGGYVALAYALQHPTHLERLALVGTWPATAPAKLLLPMLRAMGWARTTRMLARAGWWIAAYSWRRHATERRPRAFAIWSTTQEGLAPARAREIDRDARLGVPLDNDNVRALLHEFRTWDLTGRLADISCPVSLLYGERDAAAVAAAPTFRAHVRTLRARVLPDVGHEVFFEDPQAAAEFLGPFLASR